MEMDRRRMNASPVGVVDEFGETFVSMVDQEIRYDEIMNEAEEREWMMNEAYAGVPYPKASITSRTDMVPSSILFVRTIQNKECRKLLRCLFDSGASHTLINSSVLPPGVTTFSLPGLEQTMTAAGTFDSSRTVRLRDLHLPEFDRTKKMYGVQAHIFDAPCNYDIILGRDFLSEIGLKMDFGTKQVKWMETEINMKPRGYWNDQDNFFQSITDDDFDDLDYNNEEAYILDAKYEKISAKEVADQQQHLSEPERRRLEQTLAKYPILFDGRLGHYPHEQVHLELEPNSKPVHS